MNMVRCEDCGRLYDYEEDGFCPKCGAFNQPPRDKQEMRVDGVSEEGHAHSFFHREFHKEERERRHSGLDRSARRGAPEEKEQTVPAENAASRPIPGLRRPAPAGGRMSALITGVVFFIVLINLLRACAAY